MPAQTLKFFRLVHLYVGVFIAPSVLFFAFTGAIQTFSLHETTQGSTYKPPAILVSLAQIHKKQTYIIPVRKPRSDAPATATPAGADHPDRNTGGSAAVSGGAPRMPMSTNPAAKPDGTAQRPQKHHLPMKIFFLIVAVGLFASTLTGLYMSYKYANNKRILTVLLIAGVVIPPLLMAF